MKRYVLAFITIIIVCVVAYLWHYQLLYANYPDKVLQSSTGISNYTLVKKVHKNNEVYIKVVLSEADGEMLFKRHPFKHCYTKKAIAGEVQQEFITDCCSCWYYINNKNLGLYAYQLYCLSADKKQLEFYECFGD